MSNQLYVPKRFAFIAFKRSPRNTRCASVQSCVAAESVRLQWSWECQSTASRCLMFPSHLYVSITVSYVVRSLWEKTWFVKVYSWMCCYHMFLCIQWRNGFCLHVSLHVFQPFSGDQMDDFSSELFSSFFEDHLLERPLLADRSSLLHMDIDSSPGHFFLLFLLFIIMKNDNKRIYVPLSTQFFHSIKKMEKNV